MYTGWLATEHYRIHLMEQWPDGPAKEAGLAAARSALENLLRAAPPEAADFVCAECASKAHRATVIEFPTQAAASSIAA